MRSDIYLLIAFKMPLCASFPMPPPTAQDRLAGGLRPRWLYGIGTASTLYASMELNASHLTAFKATGGGAR